jgi:hypothetical protein
MAEKNNHLIFFFGEGREGGADQTIIIFIKQSNHFYKNRTHINNNQPRIHDKKFIFFRKYLISREIIE